MLEGSLGVSLDGERSTLEPGEAVEVAPGRWHDWWNAGDSTRGGAGRGDARRSVHRGDPDLFGLAVDGKTNAKGMPQLRCS